MNTQAIIILHSIFRIIVTVLCINKAKELNRSMVNWGIFGFVFPLIAIITIHVVKYKVVWPDSKHRVN